jgi:Glycosyltransferase family 87
MNESKRWMYATLTAVLFWIALVVRLMVADVWDETNGMLAFSSAAMSLGQKVQFVLTQSLGFWRPLPTLLVTVVLHFVRDFDVSWRVLRGVNVVLLLAAGWVLVQAVPRSSWGSSEFLRGDGPEELRGTPRNPRNSAPAWATPAGFIFVLAFLFSGSALITTGWYANVFDASALLLMAIALSLLLRGRDVAAGVVLGIAFFCKETAALGLPFLLVLLAAGRITFRQALRSGIPAAVLGAIYFVIRSKIVPFGSTGDVHGFDAAQFVPTIVNLSESFWRQTLKGDGPGVFGFIFLAISLVALLRPRLIGAAVVFVLATAVIYWGMFGIHQGGVLMHHLNFVGRLYLVPVTLMLFLLAIERRTFVIAVLLLPILFGAATTWRDHARFQETYKQIYRMAPVTVHYPTKPLDDTVRGVKVGDFPAAPVKVEPATGKLVR